MADSLPVSWEEMRADAEMAIASLNKVLKTPLPETVRQAAEGDYFGASGGVIEAALGHTPRAEVEQWSRRVMSLRDANKILRDFEDGIVRAFVLSSASPARLILDGLTFLAKWIVQHIAEIIYILWPLFTGVLAKFLDVVDIEEAIKQIEKAQADVERRIRECFEETPGNGLKMRSDDGVNFFLDGTGRTAAEIRDEIKELEKMAAELAREKADYVKLSNSAVAGFDYLLVAVGVVLSYLAVERLIVAAGSVSEALVTFSPVRKLRDEAVAKAKAKAFPQLDGKRTVLRKRSRRN